MYSEKAKEGEHTQNIKDSLIYYDSLPQGIQLNELLIDFDIDDDELWDATD